MLTFVDMLSGDRFIYQGRECMKLEIELVGFARPDQETNLRMNIDKPESHLHAVGMVSVIFNTVDLKNGSLLSLQSEDSIEPLSYTPDEAPKQEPEEKSSNFDFDF